MRVSWDEIAKHNTLDDCWLVIDGRVYDVTSWADKHPGGRKALLRYAGQDATAPFLRLHSASVLDEVAASLEVAQLTDAVDGATLSSDEILDSPFPHSKLEGSGLDAVRFEWARVGESLQSNLAPLNVLRDWLHVAAPSTYVPEMRMRHKLVSEHSEYVACSTVDSVDAQEEALELVLEWLLAAHSDRFKVCPETGDVQTLTPGYEHTFERRLFRQEPLKLASQLVQEDIILMREEPLSETGIQDFPRASLEAQQEDHPTGLRHVLVAGVSCFSTNVVKRHLLPMSGIHHPAVPGFSVQMQQAMNRALANLDCDSAWWRHNYMFQDFDCILLLDHPWAKFVCQEQLQARSHHKAADRSARFRVSEDEGFFKNISSPEEIRERIRMRAEYQTLRRLRRHKSYIMFTVRSYVAPVAALEAKPAAAKALSIAIRLKYKGILYYQAMGLERVQRAMLGYLDAVVQEAGLKPWRGQVPEPWERDVEEDGTFAAQAEAQARKNSNGKDRNASATIMWILLPLFLVLLWKVSFEM